MTNLKKQTHPKDNIIIRKIQPHYIIIFSNDITSLKQKKEEEVKKTRQNYTPF